MVSINFSKKNRSGPFRGTVDVKQEIGHIPFQNIIDVAVVIAAISAGLTRLLYESG